LTKPQHAFSSQIEETLSIIGDAIAFDTAEDHRRWFAIKLFERDEKVAEKFALSVEDKIKIENAINECEEALDDDSESLITNERYEYITGVVKTCVQKKTTGLTSSDKIDGIVTNRILALPIFAAVMWVVYYVSIQTVGDWSIGWVETLFEWIGGGIDGALEAAGAAAWLKGLILDGILGGVGAVLGFVPQMMILFFFLSLLEDCGYMARVAFIMDRIFRKFGLSGKSFIPMLISSGCGVPGIMATRTIENEKDRKMTIMVTTFIPCGAKLPIIALIAGALFPSASWVAPSMYFLGIGMVILSGIILKKTRLFAGEPAPFVMELPQYHIPTFKGVVIHMWERARAFIIKAGTIIFIACGVIWFLSNFGFGDGGFGMIDQNDSLLAALGGLIAPIFAPLGFGNWQAAVATITGLVAKENVVGTFGVLFGLGEVGEDSAGLLANIATMFTTVSAMSFMVFNLLCAPCFAAIGAIKREMFSWKWMFIAVGYQTVLAYVMAFIVYQLGTVIFLGAGFGIGAGIAIALILCIIWLLFRSGSNADTKELPAAAVARA